MLKYKCLTYGTLGKVFAYKHAFCYDKITYFYEKEFISFFLFSTILIHGIYIAMIFNKTQINEQAAGHKISLHIRQFQTNL